jgi:hypothetical protein
MEKRVNNLESEINKQVDLQHRLDIVEGDIYAIVKNYEKAELLKKEEIVFTMYELNGLLSLPGGPNLDENELDMIDEFFKPEWETTTKELLQSYYPKEFGLSKSRAAELGAASCIFDGVEVLKDFERGFEFRTTKKFKNPEDERCQLDMIGNVLEIPSNQVIDIHLLNNDKAFTFIFTIKETLESEPKLIKLIQHGSPGFFLTSSARKEYTGKLKSLFLAHKALVEDAVNRLVQQIEELENVRDGLEKVRSIRDKKGKHGRKRLVDEKETLYDDLLEMVNGNEVVINGIKTKLDELGKQGVKAIDENDFSKLIEKLPGFGRDEEVIGCFKQYYDDLNVSRLIHLDEFLNAPSALAPVSTS